MSISPRIQEIIANPLSEQIDINEHKQQLPERYKELESVVCSNCRINIDQLPIKKEQIYKHIDKQAGFLRLYDDETIEQLVECYIEWPTMPSRDEVGLMVNGGCIFYQFGSQPYVYGLGLKTGNDGTIVTDKDLPHLIGWFSRFADLLVRTSYKQDWYKKIIMEFDLCKQRYIQSFFTILANLAFCIQNYEDSEVQNTLKDKFKELVQFEIDRDYKKELEDQFDFERIIKEMQKQEDAKQKESELPSKDIPHETVTVDESITTQQSENEITSEKSNSITPNMFDSQGRAICCESKDQQLNNLQVVLDEPRDIEYDNTPTDQLPDSPMDTLPGDIDSEVIQVQE